MKMFTVSGLKISIFEQSLELVFRVIFEISCSLCLFSFIKSSRTFLDENSLREHCSRLKPQAHQVSCSLYLLSKQRRILQEAYENVGASAKIFIYTAYTDGESVKEDLLKISLSSFEW